MRFASTMLLVALVACAPATPPASDAPPADAAQLAALLAPVDSPLPTRAALGPDVADALVSVCLDSAERPFVRANAAYVLGEYADEPGVADVLRAVAQDDSSTVHVRARAIDGIARSAAARRDSVGLLRQWLWEDDDTLVISAIHAAETMPELRAELDKLRASSDVSPAVRPFLEP